MTGVWQGKPLKCMGQGKEAAAVRKAFLVVVLVAASFLGGVFVNGPGLQWLEARALRSLGLHNAGEIALVDLKPAASSDGNANELTLAAQSTGALERPVAPTPALLSNLNRPNMITPIALQHFKLGQNQSLAP